MALMQIGGESIKNYHDEKMENKYQNFTTNNREDLQRLVTDGYVSEEEIGKRPLLKLIKDISSELGLS